MSDFSSVYNIDLSPEIWVHKGYELSLNGGIVLPRPRPTPASVYVEHLNKTGIKVGDMICIARDTGNNLSYRPREGHLLLEPTEIKDSMFAYVKRIDGKCIFFEHDLPYWPKALGAITRVMGTAKSAINEKETELLAKIKKQNDRIMKR